MSKNTMHDGTATASRPGTGNTPAPAALRKSLKNRHVQLIALGGAIGTGLFYGSSESIALAGPSILLAYLVGGLAIFMIVRALGEMSVEDPRAGAFSYYATRYWSKRAGFVSGWNYWFNYILVSMVELSVVGSFVNYWFPAIPQWVSAAVFLVVIAAMNLLGVSKFGEFEFWFAIIKIVAVIAMIVGGLAVLIAGLPTDSGVKASFSNWFALDGGVLPHGLLQQSADGQWTGLLMALVVVMFSFGGTELIGIAAGESENPGKNIPRAVRQVFWRILLFYIFAILIISLIIPYTDPSLLRNDVKDISVSPFTLVFQHAGLLSAAAVMNAVILTAVLSAGNSGMYASTRMLFTLASEGKAPRIFAKLSKGGVPRNALYATCVVAGLCFLTSMFGNQSVYLWLLNTSGMTGFIAWLGIAISHYRFRRGYMLQGRDLNDLPYRSGFFPLGPIFAFVLCLIITLGQNYQAFLQDKIDWYGVTATYIGIPLFLLIWFGYKLSRGTRVVKYSEMEFPKMDVK